MVWHEDFDIAFVVMPVKGEATVQFSGPVHGEVVVGFGSINEMHGINVGKVLDAKVINLEIPEGKSRSLCLVVPEAGSEGHGFVAVRGELFNKLIESDDAGFFEALHSRADSEIDIAINGDGDGVTMIIPHLLGDN
jgi:hypothetical protein